ncbi:MAG: hypothetical protein WCE93_08240 [Nitrososphaeraceae archaeon]
MEGAHGFCKFYKIRAEQVMRPVNVELTMGHDIGVSKSYYKPTEKEILGDYLHAVELLSIYTNNIKELENQVKELCVRNENNESLIRAKLRERDDALSSLSDKIMKLTVEIEELKNGHRELLQIE